MIGVDLMYKAFAAIFEHDKCMDSTRLQAVCLDDKLIDRRDFTDRVTRCDKLVEVLIAAVHAASISAAGAGATGTTG